MFFFLFGHLRDLIRKRFVPRKAKVFVQLFLPFEFRLQHDITHSCFCRDMPQSVRTMKTSIQGACITVYM